MIRRLLFAMAAISCPSTAGAQERVTLGELRAGDSPDLRARLLPTKIVPLIVEGLIARPMGAAPGSWTGQWREAAVKYNADFCHRRTHRMSFFNIEAGKTTATDDTPLNAGVLYSTDEYSLALHPITTAHCAAKSAFFRSPPNRRSVDFAMARRLAGLIEQARKPGPIDFSITCGETASFAPCDIDPRRTFAALDVGRLYGLDYPMAYQTVSEERAASGRIIRLRTQTGPKDGKWENPTFSLAGPDPSVSKRLVWQATLTTTALGQTEVRLRNYFPVH